MKIALASDLHNEFYPENKAPLLPKVEADLLILGGDIELPKRHDNDWWDDVSSKYDAVIYYPGNHEYYRSYLNDYPILYYPDNVHFVRGVADLIEFQGVRILAGTMWTNLSNPNNAMIVKAMLNDYRLIKFDRNRHFITPEDTTKIWNEFNQILFKELPDIVATHHLPSFKSVDSNRYGSVENPINFGYASEINIPDSVKLWMHGHTHTPCDYLLGNTRVVANPKGYPGEGLDEDYLPKVIEYRNI